MRLLPLLAALLAACFSPDTSHIVLLCDSANPCPDSQTCVQGRCEAAPPPDQGSADGAADLGPPASGCMLGIAGTQVGSGWACPKAFAIGSARSLCAPGWVVCKSGAGIDYAACAQLGGFFAGDATAWGTGTDGSSFTCGADTGSNDRAWYGCGTKRQWVTDGTWMHCGGFQIVLNCQGSSGWDCFSGTTLDKTSNSRGTDGALCCPQ